ncbi:aminopeptidase P family protein [Acidisoma silvae]|uniref:Aminopeptidase P family protein n=1 Tax=Acidisoma silvae TaxID=2802396 RepID=A0A963YS93_9PROT|nr:aminopeptidase P family protein [Acidisoma silvae]MCB8875607.1 aminopeptidase P family protein [Acidisoma silvae]
MPSFFDRLSSLRANFAAAGIDGVLIPRSDEHLGEYVPACAERLAWLTGFTGSAGLAIALKDKAAIFIDGRYVTQVRGEVDGAHWTYRHVTDEPPADWLKDVAPAGARIGYDPLLIAEDALDRIAKAVPAVTFVPLAQNPVDAIWTDRPAEPVGAVMAYPEALAGKSAADKRGEIADILKAAGEDAAIITDPPSINWLLNIRGADVPFAPIALGFLIIRADATATLFMTPEKLGAEVRKTFGNHVTVEPRTALAAGLDGLAGKTVRVDAGASPVWFAQRLRAAGATVTAGADPCALPKACKNAVEQQGARDAQARDAAALCRFLHWLSVEAPAGQQTEMSAAEALVAFRAELTEFKEESFPAISGAGEHAAIMHYRVSPESDRAIQPNEVYLIDSGAQFLDGTTDVTRTIWTGPDAAPDLLRERFTRVLQGHIGIATLRFPEGLTGAHVDGFARHALWQVGLDFDHGTGHGVGAFLSVHEGPVAISRNSRPIPIKAGMLLSNEPGYYLPGSYGIRLENLLIAQPAAARPDGVKPFLEFETITWAPFDRALIATPLLTDAERTWLNAYHAQVLAKVGPHLAGASASWLQTACAPL